MGDLARATKLHRYALAAAGAALLATATTAQAVEIPADALSGVLATDAPGTNAGLSPRLAALADGLDAKSKSAQADALSLATRGAGSLQRQGDRIVASARVDSTTDGLIANLRAAGAEILSVNSDYGTVDLAARPDDLVAIARVPGVAAVTEALAPMVNGADGSTAPSRLNTCVGSRTAEGDSQMQVAAARAQFNVEGIGQTVGIISDSYDAGEKSATRAIQDIASGDLPGPGNPCGRTDPVKVIAEGQNTDADEGRGMAQIVHDMAPAAKLQFGESGASADAMAGIIRGLAASGSSVIVDDITFFDEPFFQDGPISNAVTEVTNAGIPYFSSAANSNVIVAGQNVGSYEAPAFRSAGACLNGLTGVCMDYNPAAGVDNIFDIVVNSGSSFNMNLQWAEPRNGVTTDYDVYVYDYTSGQIVFGAETDNIAAQKPFELVNIQNPYPSANQFGIIVYRKPTASAGTPRLKFILARASLANIQATTAPDIAGPTIFGHNGSAASVSTAAIPYDDPSKPENFSSRGPVVLYYGPVSGTTPAAPLAAPQVLNKPDIAATDNVQTTFFIDNSSGVYRFSGTSAAAPGAAGVAALQRSANPFLTPAEILAAQQSTALPVGAFGHSDVGAGLINAVGAIGAHPPIVPETTITKEPKKKVFGSKVTYKFTSNVPGSTFVCQFDKLKKFACDDKLKIKRIPYGKHRFVVSAVYNGQQDPSPAKDKFKRKHKLGR